MYFYFVNMYIHIIYILHSNCHNTNKRSNLNIKSIIYFWMVGIYIPKGISHGGLLTGGVYVCGYYVRWILVRGVFVLILSVCDVVVALYVDAVVAVTVMCVLLYNGIYGSGDSSLVDTKSVFLIS